MPLTTAVDANVISALWTGKASSAHCKLGLENARAEQQLREDAERELRKELT